MEIFDDYLQRRINVIQAFLEKMNAKDVEFGNACRSLTIEPEIVPFMIEDEKANADLAMTVTGQKAIASRKTGIKKLGWVKDIDTELKDIEAEEAVGAYSDVMEPTI